MAHIHDIKIGNTSYLIEPTLFGTATTSDNGANYTLSFTNFELAHATGVAIQVKFPITNTDGAKLNINSIGAKAIIYNNAAIAANTLKANHTYTLVYDGTQWQLVGDIDTNTWRGISDAVNSDSSSVSASSKAVKTAYDLASTKMTKVTSTDNAIVRFDGTGGEVQNSGVTIDDSNNLTVPGTINNFKLTTATSLNANDVRTNNGFWVVNASITNAAHTNHSALLGVASVGTPFQIQIPDSSIMYIYKRYYSSGAWSSWNKISAGYSDSTGAFSSNATVKLTGDVTGEKASTKGWEIATTLANSGVTAGSYGPDTNAEPGYGVTFNVPYITVDAKGRVTAASTKTIKIPASDNTWRPIGTGATDAAAGNHTHSHLVSRATIASGDSSNNNFKLALKKYFDDNKSTVSRNSLVNFYSSAYGNGSEVFGYYLSGYDNNPYGGFYVAHYDTPRYVGISNGTYTEAKLARIDIGNAITTGQVMISDGTDGKIKSSGYTIAKSVPSDAVFTDTKSFTITANATDGYWDLTGTNGTNAVTYALAPYSSKQSGANFYTGTTNPDGTTRLNYNGYLYATKLYSGGTEVSVSGHTHSYAGSSSAGGAATNATTTANTSDEIYILGVKSGATTTLLHNTKITATGGKLMLTGGGLEIKGHIAGDSGTTGHGLYSGGTYHNAYNNIILHGDATTGSSGIAFVSDKVAANGTVTNINQPSDRAFIQYHAYGITTTTAEGTAPTLATSGEAGRFVIGIGNDSGDKIVLQAPGDTDIIHQKGATGYPIPHTTNTNGSVGGTTTPVYVDAGVIKAGTALKDLAYIAKGSGSTKFLREDGTWQTALTSHQSLSAYAPLASPALTGTPTAPTADNGTNSTQIATTAFVHNTLSYVNAMRFKGTIGTGGTVTSLPNSHEAGDTYRVITENTYPIVDSNGKYCEVGTLIICIKDGKAAAAADWTAVETNEDGAVIGPTSSTNNYIAVFDGTSGRIIKSGGTTIADASVNYATSAGSAAQITTAGTTAQFYRGDNSWSNTIKQTANAQLGINSSLKIGTARKDLNFDITNGTGTGINDGYAGGITWGSGTAAYAGIYYQTSGSYGSRLHFATTNSYANGAYTRLFIGHDGKVGIGTISPDKLFTVDGEIKGTALYLKTAASDPSLSAGARIEFSYTDGQPVVLSYTPNDSYRAPAGLKIIGGTSATPAWFEIEGAAYARNYYNLVSKTLADISLVTNTLGTANSGKNNATRGAMGKAYLTIGNSTAHPAAGTAGGAGNSKGYLYIYGENTGAAEITYNDSMLVSNKSIYLSTTTNSGINNEIRGIMATNDYWRVAGGATASNSGYMEIATADDGNEPIYVRQYSGAFTTLKRTATLLDASGNTEFPVQVTAPEFIGALTGNADTATTSTWTTLIKPINEATTASASTWNIPSGSYQVWGERFSDTRLKYTPEGGSETTITDTGDWVMWLSRSGSNATLNMRIDGTYYGAFSGNVSGNASSATTSTYLTVSRVTEDCSTVSKAFPASNRAIIKEYTAGGSYHLPSNAWYHILNTQGSDTKYGTQLALGMTTAAVYYRRYDNSSWKDWLRLLDSGNTTAGTNNEATLNWDTTYTIAKINGTDIKFTTMIKPTYTYSDVGAAPTSHAHGNITSDGKIGSAAKKKLVIVGTDNKVTTGAEMDNSTTTSWLNKKGEWSTPTAANVGALASNTVVTNVAISANVTTNNNYPVVFATSNKDTTTAKNEGLQKSGTKFYFNPSSGCLYSTKFSSTAASGFYATGSPGFHNKVAAGSWAYLRLEFHTDNTKYWDIAVNSNSVDRALQFRPNGVNDIGPCIKTDGKLTTKYLNIRDGATEKVTLQWNATDQSLDFIFA